MEKFLIIGATGKVGGELTKELTEQGHQVRVLVRTQEKAQKFQGMQNVETVVGNLETKDSLINAMKDIDKLFLLVPSQPNHLQLNQNALEAAKQVGIKQIVRLSILGAQEESSNSIINWHKKSDEQLKNSGIPYTILQPNMFMQNMIMQREAIQQQNAFYGNAGEGKSAFIHVSDIASVAAKVLTEQGHESKTYQLTGPEAVSNQEIANLFSRQFNRQVNFVNLTNQEYNDSMQQAGIPEWFAVDMTSFGQMVSEGRFSQTTNQVEEITGRSPKLFKEYIESWKE